MPTTETAKTVPETPAASGGQRASLASDVYERLRDLIVSLRLSPGSPLSESDLTVRLKASRTPIRQALHRLQHEGFIVATRVGSTTRMQVAPLTIEDMRELHAILGVLEGLAARGAAALPDVRRRELAQAMRHINDELRKAWKAGPGKMREAQDLHIAFHRSFVEAGAPPRLRAVLNALQPQVERYERVYTAAFAAEFGESLEEHEQIIDAIAAGKPDEAERAAVLNWRRGTDRYVKIVKRFGERGTW